MAAGHTDLWSRRRAAVRAEAEAEAAEAAARAEAAHAAEVEARTDAEVLEELGLPDPDAMRMGDDFSAFLGRAVPERLRRRALRRLWLSNPVLANLDGLVDHGEDLTDAAVVVPDMKTAYQVGRGIVSKVLALAEEAVPAAGADLDDTPEAELEFVAIAAPEAAPDAPEPQAAPPRHMRFVFS